MCALTKATVSPKARNWNAFNLLRWKAECLVQTAQEKCDSLKWKAVFMIRRVKNFSLRTTQVEGI